jgi:DNA-directed RNA polymerase subunit RPC12/RpoP
MGKKTNKVAYYNWPNYGFLGVGAYSKHAPAIKHGKLWLAVIKPHTHHANCGCANKYLAVVNYSLQLACPTCGHSAFYKTRNITICLITGVQVGYGYNYVAPPHGGCSSRLVVCAKPYKSTIKGLFN